MQSKIKPSFIQVITAIVLILITRFCQADAIEPVKCEAEKNPKRKPVLIYPTKKEELIFAPQPLIVDQYLSPFTGASVNTSIFATYKALDDCYLYDSYGKVNFWWGIGRTGKVIAESWLSRYLMVLQHEYFGHGYRGRAFHFSQLAYSIGIGQGWTGFTRADYYALSYPQRAAMQAAGNEANTILAQQIRNNWFLTQQIDRRDANLYFANALTQTNYIYGTDKETTTVGNDIINYVNAVNGWYGSNVTSVDKLRDINWWTLLDVNLYYSIYSMGTYIIDSSAFTKMHMFDIKGYKYLPTPGLLLAPYGPEWQLQNNIVTPQQQLLQVNLRYGHTSFIKSYGVDVLMQPIYNYKGYTFGNKLYLWHQPLYLKQNTAVGVPQSFGVADYVSVQKNLYKCVDVYGEFGYKTAGYIQGNPLGNSWVWRVGVVLK